MPIAAGHGNVGDCVDLEDADDVAAMMMLLMLMLTKRKSITMTMPADAIRTPSITLKYEVWIDGHAHLLRRASILINIEPSLSQTHHSA